MTSGQSPRRWVVLGVGVIAQIASAGVNLGVAVLAPAIGARYGLSLPQIGTVLAAVSAGMTVGLIPWGLLADRVGERVVLAAGTAAAGCCLLVVAGSTGYVALLISLGVTGLCCASVIPSSGRALMYWFAPRQRGLAIGIRQTGTPLGGLAAAIALPAIVARWSLVAGFVVLAGMCFVAALAAVTYLDRWPRGAGAVPGELPYRDRRLWRLSASGFLHFFAQTATVGFVVLFLHSERGVPMAAAGVVLAGSQFGGAGLRVLLGWWADRRQQRVRLMKQFTVLTGALLGLVAVVAHGPVWLTTTTLVAAGSISQSTGGLLFTATAELAGPGRSASALGLQQTVLGLSATTSPMVFAAVVAASSWPAAFVVTAALCGLSYLVLDGSVAQR